MWLYYDTSEGLKFCVDIWNLHLIIFAVPHYLVCVCCVRILSGEINNIGLDLSRFE